MPPRPTTGSIRTEESEILEFIRDHFAKHKSSPTYTEIADCMGIKRATVYNRCLGLKRRGLLQTDMRRVALAIEDLPLVITGVIYKGITECNEVLDQAGLVPAGCYALKIMETRSDCLPGDLLICSTRAPRRGDKIVFGENGEISRYNGSEVDVRGVVISLIRRFA